MKQINLLALAALFCNSTFSQTDTTKSVYKDITTKKFYNLGYSTYLKDNITTYKINEKEVDKITYDKYHDTWKNMESCKPCILLTYDYNDNLLYKGIQYTDCRVGFWIEYFSNGQVKIIGHYKENGNGYWKDAYDKGFCREDGIWTYFNEKGNKLYSEYWKDGQFIKQEPEQSKTELWTVELTYNGTKINNRVFTPKQVGEIKIVPKFKNSTTTGTNFTVKFEIATTGHKVVDKIFSLDDFSKIDVQKMFLESGIMPTETASCSIMIFNNGNNVFNSWFKVRQ